jgi:hypothetical protein
MIKKSRDRRLPRYDCLAARTALFQNLDQYDHPTALLEASDKIFATLNYLQDTIRSRYALYLREHQGKYPVCGGELYKVLVRLSVDQIAIILKAADDVKILASSFLSLIYRRIMPFIATERCKEQLVSKTLLLLHE